MGRTSTTLMCALALTIGLAFAPASGVFAAKPPTPAEIEAKRQQARQLEREAAGLASAVVVAQQQLQTLSAQAEVALGQLRAAQAEEAAAIAAAEAARAAEAAARLVEQRALTKERRALDRLAIATAERNQMQTAVNSYSAAVYRGGYTAGLGQITSLIEAESPGEFARTLELWGQTGDSQGRLLDLLEVKQAEMEGLRAEAESARQEAEAQRAEAERQAEIAAAEEARAEEARQAAAAAKAQADALAAQAAATVQATQASQVAKTSAAASTAAEADQLQQKRDEYLEAERQRIEAERRARIPQTSDEVSVGGGGGGGGGGSYGGGGSSVGCANPYPETRGGYRNGCIPTSALSRISIYSGHYLRSDAASAFDQLNAAFAARFGYDIYVTDSYRSYPAQVALKRQKPVLAARPGTSNHGWGVAVDLGSGINSFGTPTHRWMQDNAAAFGWCHPRWAQAGGSKPEAWHWEYQSASC